MPDTSRIELLCDISGDYVTQDATVGLQYGFKALALAQKIEWSKGRQNASLFIGNNFRALSQNDSARWYYRNAVDIAEAQGDKLGLANCYNAIGLQYQSTSNYPEALRYLYKALALFGEISKPQGEAICFGNIGVIYDNQKQFDKALENYSRALNIFQAIGDKESADINLTNIGFLHHQMGNFEKALSIEKQALERAQTLGLDNLVWINLYNIGLTYAALRHFSTAIEFQQKALTEASRHGDRYFLSMSKGGIGTIYTQAANDSTGQGLSQLSLSRTAAFHKGIEYLTEAIDSLDEESALRDLTGFYYSRHEAYEALGDSLAGARDFRKYVMYHDTVFSIENGITIANLETARALQLADKQIELDKLAVQKKRNESAFFVGGICLLLFVVLFISRERKRSEHLLLNILPAKIAARLKEDEHPIADAFEEVGIIFIDMAGFTSLMREQEPKYTVSILNDIFTRFDVLAEKHGVEKIKTIGDCYMAVAGLPEPQSDYAQRIAAMAIDVQEAMLDYLTPDGRKVSFRIGIDCGTVVAGVIGQRKFIYDLWGDCVNTASRMQTSGVPGEIHCTQNFKEAVGDRYHFTLNGVVEVKGIGQMETWLLRSV